MSSEKTKEVLSKNRELWDNSDTRVSVRKSFQKVLDCGTLALGATVYESSSGERKLIYHTCKSKACQSCGHWATQRWQREIEAILPNTHYAAISFTMSREFWTIMKENRHLLQDLPAIGAGVPQDWAMDKFSAEIVALVICHTFGYAMEFKPHLHLLVATTGLRKIDGQLARCLYFPRDILVRRWRDALLSYVKQAHARGVLISNLTDLEIETLVEDHRDRLWIGKVEYIKSKDTVTKYISRYLRRPPIANSHFKSFSNGEVEFMTKDTKNHQRVLISLSLQEFIFRLGHHIPDHYLHSVHYFGLLSPRLINNRFRIFLCRLGQVRRERPRPLHWEASIRLTFGRDPLLTIDGERLYKVGVILGKREPFDAAT